MFPNVHGPRPPELFHERICEIDIVAGVGLNPFKELTSDKTCFFFKLPGQETSKACFTPSFEKFTPKNGVLTPFWVKVAYVVIKSERVVEVVSLRRKIEDLEDLYFHDPAMLIARKTV